MPRASIFTDADNAAIVRMRAAGVSWKVVAAALGHGSEGVRDHAHRRGPARPVPPHVLGRHLARAGDKAVTDLSEILDTVRHGQSNQADRYALAEILWRYAEGNVLSVTERIALVAIRERA